MSFWYTGVGRLSSTDQYRLDGLINTKIKKRKLKESSYTENPPKHENIRSSFNKKSKESLEPWKKQETELWVEKTLYRLWTRAVNHIKSDVKTIQESNIPPERLSLELNGNRNRKWAPEQQTEKPSHPRPWKHTSEQNRGSSEDLKTRSFHVCLVWSFVLDWSYDQFWILLWVSWLGQCSDLFCACFPQVDSGS